MSLLNEKNRKKQQAQDLATRRILAVFVAAAVILWIMSYVYDIMSFGTTFLMGVKINKIVLAVSGIAAVVSFVFYAVNKKRGAYHVERVFNSGFFALCTTVLFFCAATLAMDFYGGMHTLYVFLPVTAVLFLVYHIYERSFFALCAVEALAIAAAYSCYANAYMKYVLLALAILSALAIILVTAGKSTSLNKFRVAVLGGAANNRYTLLSYGGTVAVLVIAAVLGGKIALLAALALGVYLLASAVYYTVKAM